MKRNDAEQIGKLIRSFLRQESLESPLNERRLINSWAEVLGPVIASYTPDSLYKESGAVRASYFCCPSSGTDDGKRFVGT